MESWSFFFCKKIFFIVKQCFLLTEMILKVIGLKDIFKKTSQQKKSKKCYNLKDLIVLFGLVGRFWACFFEFLSV